MTIKVFTTIDQCVDFLVNLGCKWTYKKEQALIKKYQYTYKNITVLYDKYDILA